MQSYKKSSAAAAQKQKKTGSGKEETSAARTITTGEFDVTAGRNDVCLPSLGVYQLTPQSCHRFDKQNYVYNT